MNKTMPVSSEQENKKGNWGQTETLIWGRKGHENYNWGKCNQNNMKRRWESPEECIGSLHVPQSREKA